VRVPGWWGVGDGLLCGAEHTMFGQRAAIVGSACLARMEEAR
jgi:hypothetical protein